MMKVNPDDKIVKAIRDRLKVTDGQCPCVPFKEWNEDTKCPCKLMREKQECHCGLFVKA